MALASLAAIGWISFVVALCLLLGRAEGSPPWRSAVALVSGVVLAAYLLLNTSGNAASFGAADLDLAVANYAFDVRQYWACQRLALHGRFCGVLRLGWCCRPESSVVGLAGGPSPAGSGSCSPDSSGPLWFWFLPYAAFWIWLIIMCIQLVRKPRAVLRWQTGKPALAVNDRDCRRPHVRTFIDRRCPLGRRYHLDLAARFGVPTVQVCARQRAARGACSI